MKDTFLVNMVQVVGSDGGFTTYLNSTEMPFARVFWFSGNGFEPSMTLFGMLSIWYNLRTLASCSATLAVSSSKVKTELENEEAFSRMRCRDARERGIVAGHWTARRVNAICLDSKQNTRSGVGMAYLG